MAEILTPKLRRWMSTRDVDGLTVCLSKLETDRSTDESILDLSDLHWIDLLPFAVLRLWLHDIGRKGNRKVIVKLPPSPPNNLREYAILPRACPERVAGFLAKWNFGECFQYETIRPSKGDWELRRDDPRVQDIGGEVSSDDYLYVGPSCLFASMESVTTFTEELDSPRGLFYPRVQEYGALSDSEVAEHAFLLVEELGRNIFDHNSKDVVGVACHRLVRPFGTAPNKSEREETRRKYSAKWEESFFEANSTGGYLEFVIGDNGSGIAATLKGHGTGAEIVDNRVLLKHAFERFSSRREKLTTRMRGLYCVLENLRHVCGTLSVASNGVRLTWNCYNGGIPKPEETECNHFGKGTFYQVLIPLESSLLKTRSESVGMIPVVIPAVSKSHRLQPISVHKIWHKHRHQQNGPFSGIAAPIEDLRAILENPAQNVLYILDFAGLNWSREECYEVMKPLIAAWRQRVPFVMINVSPGLRTHMQYSDRGFLFKEYFCILPVLDKVPFWVGLDEGSETEKQLAASLTSCVQALSQNLKGPFSVSFAASRKKYPDISVFWKDNPTLFDSSSFEKGVGAVTFSLDIKNILDSFDDIFQSSFKEYLEGTIGVLSQASDAVYELPGGGYTDTFIDLRGLLINNPFKSAIYERIADLITQVSNESGANTVAAYGDIGGKLLGTLERRNLNLNHLELGGWRQLGSIRASDFFDKNDRVLILTDVIGLGHAATQIASLVRSGGGVPVAIVAILDARDATTVSTPVDGVPVYVVSKRATTHWLKKPEDKSVIRFDPQKGPFDPPVSTSLPPVILAPHQFWSLVQKARALHLGHREIRGRRLRLHVSSRKLAQDPVVNQYIMKKIQNFAEQGAKYDFVLLPSKRKSGSASHFRETLHKAIPSARIIEHESGSTDLLSQKPGSHVLIFDYGTMTGSTLSSLLSDCPVGTTVDILVFMDRMQGEDWRILKARAPDLIKRIAVLYRIAASDIILPDENELAAHGENLRRLESWVATHRMLEYIEEQRDALAIPMETETETDEAEPSAFSSTQIKAVSEIDSHAQKCRAKSDVDELSRLLLSTVKTTTEELTQRLFDVQIYRGIARDLTSRTHDPVVVLDVIVHNDSHEIRTELLDSFFLEHSAGWPVLKKAVVRYQEALLRLAEKSESVREIESIIHVLAKLNKAAYLENLPRLFKCAEANDRLLCAMSFDVARFLADDGQDGKDTSNAVHSACAKLLQAISPPIALEPIRRFLENIGFQISPNNVPSTDRLNYTEFFNKTADECFPAEVLCLYLTDFLLQKFGKNCRASVWRVCADRKELQCIAASPSVGEGRVYTQIEGRLTGIPVTFEKRHVLIKDITDQKELFESQVPISMVTDFANWAKTKGYKSLSVLLLPIEDRHGLYGVCRIIKLWNNKKEALVDDDLEWVNVRLERFRNVGPEFGVARRDLAFASKLGRKFAEIAWSGNRSVRERIDGICEEINNSFGVQWCAVAWIDSKQDVLVRYGNAGRGWTEAARQRVMEHRADKFLSWSVLESGKPAYSPDIHQKPRVTNPPMDFLRSCIAIPLIRGKDRCGVLTLWSDLVSGLSSLWSDKACLDLAAVETAQVVGLILGQEQESRIAHDLARGMSYSLHTRAGILEFELSLLKWKLGAEHGTAISKMAEAIEFFKHASALATKDLRFAEVGTENAKYINLNSIVTQVVEHRQDGRISLNLTPALLTVQMNRAHSEDIIIEIISNALDFTDQIMGRVEVRTTIDCGFARVDIQDNGPGIFPSLRGDLFKRFKRYPEGRMGLGLAYSKGIAQAYGGEINEVSKEGEGAHFVVKIPLAKEDKNDTRNSASVDFSCR